MGLEFQRKPFITFFPSYLSPRNSNNLHKNNRQFSASVSLFLASVLLALVLFIQVAAASGPEAASKLIRGLITTNDGQPVADATIEICDLRGDEIARSITDSSGRFEIITDTPPGAYELVVTNSRQLNDERIILGRTDVDIKISVTGAPQSASRLPGYVVSSRQLGIPPKVRVHIAAAQEQFNKLNMVEARRELDIALRIDPSCSEAWSMKALVKLAAKDLPGAVEDAKNAMKLDSGSAEAYLTLGTAYNAQKDFQHAEEALRRALELHPDSWQAQLEVAKAWYGEKRFVLALRQLEMMDKDFPDAHLVRANVLMSLGRQQEGAGEFNVFLREVPGDRRAPKIREILAKLAETMQTERPEKNSY